MNYRKHGLKALGLSFLAVLGLMAFAAAAQANSTVTVLKDGVGSSLNVTITGEEHNALEGELLILNLNMEISCHAATAAGSLSAAGTGLATITFENCLAKGTSGGATCTIPNIVATTKALVVTHTDGVNYVIFSPDDLLTFAKVLNHTECALPENANVKGCVAAKVETGHAINQLITTDPAKFAQSLFNCKLTYGANPAHLDVDALVALTGAHEGLSWGV